MTKLHKRYKPAMRSDYTSAMRQARRRALYAQMREALMIIEETTTDADSRQWAISGLEGVIARPDTDEQPKNTARGDGDISEADVAKILRKVLADQDAAGQPEKGP